MPLTKQVVGLVSQVIDNDLMLCKTHLDVRGGRAKCGVLAVSCLDILDGSSRSPKLLRYWLSGKALSTGQPLFLSLSTDDARVGGRNIKNAFFAVPRNHGWWSVPQAIGAPRKIPLPRCRFPPRSRRLWLLRQRSVWVCVFVVLDTHTTGPCISVRVLDTHTAGRPISETDGGPVSRKGRFQVGGALVGRDASGLVNARS